MVKHWEYANYPQKNLTNELNMRKMQGKQEGPKHAWNFLEMRILNASITGTCNPMHTHTLCEEINSP